MFSWKYPLLMAIFMAWIWPTNLACDAKGIVEFVNPVKRVLENIQSPLKLTAMVCWDLETRFEFIKGILLSPNQNRDYQLGITDVMLQYFPAVLDENHQIIVMDLICNQTKALLTEIGPRLHNKFRFIILNSCEAEADDARNNKIEAIFGGLPVLPNSEIFCIIQNGTQQFTIKQVYRTSMRNRLIIEDFGYYRHGILYDERSERVTTLRRRNLQGVNLRATLVLTNNDSVNHLNDYKDRHIDTISKVCYFLTNYLADYVNGEVNYTFASSWGYQDENTGQWSGMIGDLTSNKSDIGASALFYTTDRIVFIEYIAMPTPTRSKFVFRSPKLSYTDNVFLLPFDRLVWYSLFGLIGVTALTLLVATFIESKLQIAASEDGVDNSGGLLRPSFLDVFMLVFGATCQQGSAVAPNSITARTIMMLAFTILMFLYTSYSANIVALLQSPSNKINTLEDLLNSRLKMGADDTVFNRHYFTHSTEKIRKKIFNQKIRNRDGTLNFLTLENGVQKLREGLYAFHMEIGVGYKVVGETFLEDEKCGLQEIQYLQVVDPWYAIQKNSSYKELFKTGMMRINEHGLQGRENAKLYTKKPKCVGGGGKFITASLVDTRPAIYVLLWGFVTSIGLLLIELICGWLLEHAKVSALKKDTRQ